jgi:hypothetical protein
MNYPVKIVHKNLRSYPKKIVTVLQDCSMKISEKNA